MKSGERRKEERGDSEREAERRRGEKELASMAMTNL